MTRSTKIFLTIGLMLTATTAAAHPGHAEGGFTSGLLHPLMGLDHLLAMAAVGLWSMRQSTFMKRGTPLFVVGGMLLGAGLAWGGLALPGVETGITLSVLLAGVLLATLVKLPLAVGASLVVVFMVFHGFAHGTEMPAGATLAAYMAGFSMATLAITFAGAGLGALLMKTDSRVTRGIGAAIVASGAFLAS
ncbi:HupE/UreJ family protein [Marinobacter nanhaiticus D15-8W]|uniref:Urease accessory protein UreJ n=1 Tax=Marinobacter nanhaiticus D15-8W TaxID=626887 RepID=N6WP51_9GAMM|nr:HupE/UreJ family protein [Marinobacter nanhaiticus]ENO12822.1 urease accessory protein UreJ [Marinobacter nanhaiticus D15-8W]BES70171.1 HupE/UreJ family protein [Marinobacter nanhaiticus D15-8W]